MGGSVGVAEGAALGASEGLVGEWDGAKVGVALGDHEGGGVGMPEGSDEGDRPNA